ncbi:MAG: HemK2/MTQ2 family protein methyltransferase [Candidatus Micrarchaeota archaeon]
MSPFLNGIRLSVFPDVYEPAEDSLLLAKYSSRARGRILDMGTGCGIQALAAAKSGSATDITGADISARAVENAEQNANSNGARCDFLVSDLFEKISGTFDTIIFNPPYLPTSRDELTCAPLDLAWNGGEDGRRVIDRFLDSFPPSLAREGKLFLLHSSLADTEKTIRLLAQKNFRARILEEMNVGFETLSVIEAMRVPGW